MNLNTRPLVQALGCRLGQCFCAVHRGVHRTPALGYRLGRCFCAVHRGVHRTPAPRHSDHLKKKVLTYGGYFFIGLLVPNLRDQASSPKRVLWTKKRGEDGAAVKIARRSKPKSNFGNRKRAEGATPPEFNINIAKQVLHSTPAFVI